MEITARADTVNRIWQQLKSKHQPGRNDGRRTAHLDVIKEGWGANHDVQDILYETDDRADMLIRHHDDFECLLLPYGLHFESRFRGPFSGTTKAWGHRAMRAADIAMYVMEIERLGFSVDAEPLVAALRPQLVRQKYLTNGELSVLWYSKQRHRCDPIVLRIENVKPTAAETVVTHSGYQATAMLQDDRAVVIRVDAPRSKKGFPIQYWIAGEMNRVTS